MKKDTTVKKPKKRGRPRKNAPKVTKELITGSKAIFDESNPKPTYGNPPRNYMSNRPPTNASTGSLVEQYNLTSLVKEMRCKGKSYREIADYINDNGLLPDQYKLSYSSIVRWCQNNNLAGFIDSEEAYSINAYNENLKLFQIIMSAREKVSVMLDEFDNKMRKGDVSASELDILIKALDRLTLRQQTLASSLIDMQDKIYRYETVCMVMTKIMAIVSVNVPPEVYDELKAMLRDDPILCKALTNIAPTNTVV